MNVFIPWSEPDRYAAVTIVNDSDIRRLNEGFRGATMGADWVRLPVERLIENPSDARLTVGDFPSFEGIPVFSARAVRELGDLLEGRGELLPLASDEGEYYAFNVTHLSDALDEDASEIARFDDARVMDFDSYEFVPERLGGETIFKLVQLPQVYTYVTDTFVDRVRERDLKGFRFQQVWPNADD